MNDADCVALFTLAITDGDLLPLSSGQRDEMTVTANSSLLALLVGRVATAAAAAAGCDTFPRSSRSPPDPHANKMDRLFP